MELENGRTGETSSPKPDDAGIGNKMASSSEKPINKEKTVEHELKIMDVEGAVTAETTLTIELDDDDVEVVNDPSVSELPTVLIDNEHEKKSTEDPLEDEKASTKTEPSSDVESTGSYNGPDPMGLLERIDSSKEVDDDDEEESADEASSSGSRRISRRERWQIWMKRWPWLLHEESDGDYAFCLYCNVVINVNKKLKHVQQHNLSLYHQERENNYLAFKNSDDYARLGTSEHEVKHEFGTDNYVAAMKQKRANEVEKLNNFNWMRWLNWHQWLERIQPEGTIGLCKYCNVRMNVEFVYLRKRHETSKGHCEAQRTHQEKSARKRKRSASQEDNSVDAASEPKAQNEDSNVMTVVGAGLETTDPSDWCELLPDTNPQQCRCTLCDCRMAITSFMRHLKTKVHCSNLFAHKGTQSSKLNRGIWAQYAEQHPWLVADPTDPTLAYCHICSRRFIYGHSEIKRKTHENSEKHLAAVAASVAAATEEARNNDEEEQSEQEQSEAQSEGSDDDYVDEDDKLSTTPRSSAEPTEVTAESRKTKRVVRHFWWLRYSRDRKIQQCKFCRVRFSSEWAKVRHEQSARHQRLIHQYKVRQTARRKEARKKHTEDAGGEAAEDEEENDEEQSNADSAAVAEGNNSEVSNQPKVTNKAAHKPVPATMQGKVMVWKDRFPWLSWKRSEPRHNYGWCKLCEVSVFLPSFKYASKHQRSTRHVRLRFERKKAARMPPTDVASVSTPTTPALATGEAKNKAAMAELQAKYDWLEPDATDENHCHCKICDTRLPIKLFYLRQHDGSRKHLEQLERLRNNSGVTSLGVNVAEPAASVMDMDQESDEALSFKSEYSTGEQPPSKRMRRSLEVRRILRVLRDSVGKRNDERSQLDMAKDMICSSFDIVSRLRTLERENESPVIASRNHVEANSFAAQPRDTIDLFFESITQTMKTLPGDLAAEGKAKIMQIVCDLELRGMQRNASVPTIVEPEVETRSELQLNETTASSTAENSSTRRTSDRMTFEEVLDVPPASPESVSSSITIDDLMEDSPAQSKQSLSNDNHIAGNPSELTVTPKQRPTIRTNPSPPASTVTVSAAPSVNGRVKEVPLNIRRYLPSSVQVGTSKQDASDALRIVPINKLTTPNANPSNVRNSMNSAGHSSPLMQRSGQQSNHGTPNSIVMHTPPNSNSSVHSDLSNGTSSGSGGSTPLYRKIRVNNGTSTKLITFQNSGQQKQQSQQHYHQLQPHQISQQQKLSMRYSSGGGSTALTPAHVQAQAQLRALSANRAVVRHLPANNRTTQP
ncbi:protein suppressor of variegation 3-7 isoform X2 [Drosophila virilis]|uniref:Su(Var)3-7, isoform A n=1 Tax=Drosophila virilis TaxID=7244 RepID=B4M6D4_DROVI|nr:protein suppressor of variegation 3-7 isoform X2 [Drosophila virilis]EDW59210.1 Su(var)3-7, isoform A [Drosophila virilis]